MSKTVHPEGEGKLLNKRIEESESFISELTEKYDRYRKNFEEALNLKDNEGIIKVSGYLDGVFEELLESCETLLQENRNTERCIRQIKKITELSRSSYHMLGSLIDLEKSYMAGKKIIPAELDVNYMILKALSEMKAAAGSADIELNLELNPGCSAFADIEAFSTVFTGLCNEVIISGEGGDKIEIKSKKNEETVFISVKSSSPEFGKEEAAEMMTSGAVYFTENDDQKDKTAKILMLSRDILNLFGGDLQVTGKTEAGRSFIITLPRKEYKVNEKNTGSPSQL